MDLFAVVEQQLRVKRFLARTAQEMLHQGAPQLHLAAVGAEVKLSLVRNGAPIAARSVEAGWLPLIQQWLSEHGYLAKGGKTSWIGSTEKVLELIIRRTQPDILLEVSGVLSWEQLIDELGPEVGTRALLQRLSALESGSVAISAPSDIDTRFAAALFETGTVGVTLPLDRYLSLTKNNRNVNTLPIGVVASAQSLQLNIEQLIANGVGDLRAALHVQRIPEVCRDCAVVAPYERNPKLRVGRAGGCPMCGGTGTRGYAAIVQVALFSQPPTATTAAQWIREIPNRGPDIILRASRSLFAAEVLDQFSELSSETSKEVAASRSIAKPASVPQLPKILLVEDDHDQRALLAATLQKSGFEVCATEDGLRALAALEQFTPNLIITDLMMPNMDGATFIAQVRRNDNWRALPILVLTVLDDQERELNVLELGADDYCDKTIQRKLLLKRIEMLLRRTT